ncbi:MAG: hypothetical protein IJX77_06310, partial [Ruminococcus sp.]|nr:hypothetical protein [Ruminococcus sp.]
MIISYSKKEIKPCASSNVSVKQTASHEIQNTLAKIGEGFSFFRFKFQYFINITYHILVLYLSL